MQTARQFLEQLCPSTGPPQAAYGSPTLHGICLWLLMSTPLGLEIHQRAAPRQSTAGSLGRPHNWAQPQRSCLQARFRRNLPRVELCYCLWGCKNNLSIECRTKERAPQTWQEGKSLESLPPPIVSMVHRSPHLPAGPLQT